VEQFPDYLSAALSRPLSRSSETPLGQDTDSDRLPFYNSCNRNVEFKS
jgi:hypothetical protein